MKLGLQFFFSAVLVWGVNTSLAQAGTGADRMRDFFEQVKSMQADFEQTVSDATGKISQRAQGTMAIQRPGKFRWDYKHPYEQLIIANGKKVWIYDQDLEQVTVRTLDNAVGNTPAQLLSSGQSLEKSFAIVEVGPSEGLEWVELTPRDRDTSFAQVRLAFDARDLQQMQLIDSFGQTTHIWFRKILRNPSINASIFEFKPPPGIDIIGE